METKRKMYYDSPSAIVVELNCQSILCTSEPQSATGEDFIWI